MLNHFNTVVNIDKIVLKILVYKVLDFNLSKYVFNSFGIVTI